MVASAAGSAHSCMSRKFDSYRALAAAVMMMMMIDRVEEMFLTSYHCDVSWLLHPLGSCWLKVVPNR